MNVRINTQDESQYAERRLNNKWTKIDVENLVSQLVISKSKLLELVSTFDELKEHCDQDEILNILTILHDIKQNAINKIEDDMFTMIRYRLHKEEQKAIANDPSSDKPYCFIASPVTSESESERQLDA